LEELAQLDTPCILHWDLDHFVVLAKAGKRTVRILDPARGELTLTMGEVSQRFTGIALELTPTADFQPRKIENRTRLSDFWSRISGFTPIIVQLFLLTLVLQMFSLLMPLANQIVVDDVIARGDQQMLLAMLIGFGLLAIVQTGISFL